VSWATRSQRIGGATPQILPPKRAGASEPPMCVPRCGSESLDSAAQMNQPHR
jgi:hypothetical protein